MPQRGNVTRRLHRCHPWPTYSIRSGCDRSAAAGGAVSLTSQTPGQIAAQVAAGRTDAGFVYASDLTAAMTAKLHVVSIPSAGAPTVTFEVAVVRKTKNQSAAQAYVARILSPTGQAALRRRGFGRA